jgi:5-methylcytosine-specific restriction endonuclease McrA
LVSNHFVTDNVVVLGSGMDGNLPCLNTASFQLLNVSQWKKKHTMAYILDLIRGTIQPKPDRITLERYVVEDSYITKYLSRIVKDKALVVYHVLFHLSWFETGKGSLVVPWARLGEFIMSEQGNIIANNTTVRRRLPDLLRNQCISVTRQRSGANEVSVHLPSDIPVCRELIDREEVTLEEALAKDERDYYTDPDRRLEILARDNRRCAYCTIDVSEDDFVLDHLVPVSKGGTNRKTNLVTCCASCNQRKQDGDPVEFLLENYRAKLLTQPEYLKLKAHIEAQLSEDNG